MAMKYKLLLTVLVNFHFLEFGTGLADSNRYTENGVSRESRVFRENFVNYVLSTGILAD